MGQINELKDFTRGQLDAALMKIGQDAGMGTAEGIHAFLRGELAVAVSRPTPVLPGNHKLSISRITPFNPTPLLGADWSIMEEDERSLDLMEIDLGAIRFETMLRSNETYINGEEKQRRLKAAGHIRLDAKIFQALWENKHRIPESWKKKTNGNTTFIYFDGTILRDPGGGRCVLYLYWDGDQWSWGHSWLGRGWGAEDPSAVLAS